MRQDASNKATQRALTDLSNPSASNVRGSSVSSQRKAKILGQDFIGQSTAFDSIVEVIDAVAARRCSVIISGETGAGKEMVARQIHQHGDRNDKVFVPVDCTTLTGQLFESQLFGHVKGAFTGAVTDTLGFFRAANGGTIFLDEISEIPLELQAKLLRVLQENVVTPVGSTKSYPIDIRVLCATNRNLAEMVRNDRFRADLYYRLNVVNLEVPPLRQRRDDIIPLAKYFLNNQSIFYNEPPKILSAKTKQLFMDYSWPGNVRELANAIERAYVMSKGRTIEPSAMPFDMITNDVTNTVRNDMPTLDTIQRKLVVQTLEFTRGRKIAAAKILGIERRRLNRLIERLDITLPDKSNGRD
ncbi:MAG: sigma-54-dependent Fis family transcriptional regulator [Planctomycetes bacterium]|nr:sigma-54-dependent Fis family transcriptional regulator [Planctomycetota bacterium]